MSRDRAVTTCCLWVITMAFDMAGDVAFLAGHRIERWAWAALSVAGMWLFYDRATVKS